MMWYTREKSLYPTKRALHLVGEKNPDIYWEKPVFWTRVSHTPVCEPLRFTNDEFFVKPREKPCISCKKPSGSCKEPCISWKSITHASVWAAEIHKRQILCKPPGKALYFVQRTLYLVEEYHTRQPRRLTHDALFVVPQLFVLPQKKPYGSCKEPCISWKSITHTSRSDSSALQNTLQYTL